jgi:hypothetical protein
MAEQLMRYAVQAAALSILLMGGEPCVAVAQDASGRDLAVIGDRGVLCTLARIPPVGATLGGSKQPLLVIDGQVMGLLRYPEDLACSESDAESFDSVQFLRSSAASEMFGPIGKDGAVLLVGASEELIQRLNSVKKVGQGRSFGASRAM